MKKILFSALVLLTRTDSMVFDKTTRTLIYFCSFTDKMDNAEIVNANRTKLSDGLREGLLNDTGLKTYREAGFHFKYIVRSAKDPKKALYQEKF